ncbi:MAG: hypothetical protein AAF267_07645 [Deinococcota bacterium]
MKTVSVTAHFDGKHIQLDEPLDLKPNTKLMVTVLPAQDSEREAWSRFSLEGLARAYSDNDEAYDLSDIKVPNPTYDRG